MHLHFILIISSPLYYSGEKLYLYSLDHYIIDEFPPDGRNQDQ